MLCPLQLLWQQRNKQHSFSTGRPRRADGCISFFWYGSANHRYLCATAHPHSAVRFWRVASSAGEQEGPRRRAGWGSTARPLRWYIGATPCTLHQTASGIEHRRALSLRCSHCPRTPLRFYSPVCTNGPVVHPERPRAQPAGGTLDCMLQELVELPAQQLSAIAAPEAQEACNRAATHS